MFKTDWSKDETYHWHDCENASCLEISDKAEHTYQDDICSICGFVKESIPNIGITENKWNEMISLAKFNNVTITFFGELNTGLSTIPFNYKYKLDGESCSEVFADGNEKLQGEGTANSLKEVYVKTTLAMFKNYADFSYNSDLDKYVNNDNIVYEISIMGKPATITASNVVLTLDSNSNIASINLNMKQDFVEQNTPKTFNLNITFVFSDYLTTQINSSN